MATTQPSEQAKQEAQRRQAALAVGASAIAPPAAGVAAGVGIPAATVRAQAAAVVLAGLVAFLARQRQESERWLEVQLTVRGSGPGVPPVSPDDVRQVIADETLRDEVFARRQSERVARDTATALSLADPAQREAQMQKIMDREKLYAQMRQEAMAARAFAAIDRARLRMESPQGAYWALGDAKEHTAGCLTLHAIGFLPWEVLNRVHPPRHPGCTAYLVGYGDAIKLGLMAPGDVLPVRDAIRQAKDVLMESDEDAAAALDEELRMLDLRDALVSAGLTTPELFDAAAR